MRAEFLYIDDNGSTNIFPVLMSLFRDCETIDKSNATLTFGSGLAIPNEKISTYAFRA